MAPAVRVVSDKWFVRVDGPETFLRQKCRELQNWIDVQVCHGIYHAGKSVKENPHAHVIMTMTTVLQKQSFDIRIKKLFEIVRGVDYSTKLWDGNYGEGAGSYLYHEGEDSPVLCSKGITDLQIEEFKKANASVQRMVALNKEKAGNKLVEQALEHFKLDTWTSESMEYDIFRFMFKRVSEGTNHHPGDSRLKMFVQEVHARLCPANRFEDFAYSRYEKMFR